MKRLSEFIKTLSLTQQLIMLIIFFVGFFSVFFFVYINGSVKNAIQEEIFQNLDHIQNTIELMDGYDQLPSSVNGVSIYEMKPIDDKHYWINSMGDSISEKELDVIAAAVEQFQTSKTNRIHGEYEGAYQGLDSFYSLYKTSDGHILLARTYSNNMNKLEGILVNSVVYITVIVVGFFFVILALWVLTLIHPLNQIRNYIEKVKSGEDASLSIKRSDEIGELADALVDMRQELKRQEKTKEEMIHNISHDLKTPIATIKSYGESIKDGIFPYDTLEKSVDVIIENADRLESKVHSLLYMNRVEYLISHNDEAATTNMKELIEMVVLNTRVIKPEIEMEIKLQEVYFDGIAEPWRVAVENILENALRYAKSKIVIELTQNDGLSISNDGPCMDEERIKTLFKPFEKGAGGKFGLGLSIVSKVVNANHYEVVGENLPQGVVFRIYKKHKN